MDKVLKEVRGRGKSKRGRLVGVKLNELELKQVTLAAKMFTKGSRAKWARIAMLNYKPEQKDFE